MATFVVPVQKQAILEHVLNRFLASWEIERIRDGWNAFYEDPKAYAGTVVVDMVNHALDVRKESA